MKKKDLNSLQKELQQLKRRLSKRNQKNKRSQRHHKRLNKQSQQVREKHFQKQLEIIYGQHIVDDLWMENVIVVTHVYSLKHLR